MTWTGPVSAHGERLSFVNKPAWKPRRRELPHPKPDGLKVVEARHRDIAGIRTFILDAWMIAGPSAWGWTGASEENVKALASVGHLEALITNPGVKIYLAREDRKIVGFAVTRELDRDAVELAGIIVDEYHTGKGVGTALAQRAIASAFELRYMEIIVKTEAFNKRAIGFYERNGFARDGASTEEVDGKKIELVVLKRKLH